MKILNLELFVPFIFKDFALQILVNPLISCHNNRFVEFRLVNYIF